MIFLSGHPKKIKSKNISFKQKNLKQYPAYISPKIPANVFFKFASVSSDSSLFPVSPPYWQKKNNSKIRKKNGISFTSATFDDCLRRVWPIFPIHCDGVERVLLGLAVVEEL